MGKKIKKLNNIVNTVENVEKPEIEDSTNLCANTDNIKVTKSKKKSRKRDCNSDLTEDTPVQIETVEVNESNNTADSITNKIKNKKKKERPEVIEQELSEETQKSKIDDQLSPPKKKRKKGKLPDKDSKEVDQAYGEIEDLNLPKDSEKKKKDNVINKPNSQDVAKKESVEVKQTKKKPRKKAKTGAPVLNDEEAQVTQEEIDQFCDELDEEDNKQYEDWVKLLEVRLGKKQPKD